MGQRSHHGSDTFLDESAEHLSISLVDIAHKTKVDSILNRTLMRTNHIHIGTRQSQGIHTIRLQTGHKVLIHQAAIDHSHNTQHLSIGDTTAVQHLRLNTESLSDLRGLTTSTMYQNLLAFDGTEILQQLRELSLILDDGPTHLYNCQFLFH